VSLCDKVREMINEGWKLVDVREPQEFSAVHLKEATNVPLQQVVHLDRNNKYMLYCRSGARSGSAANYLAQQGIEAVNIGGIHQYQDCLEG